MMPRSWAPDAGPSLDQLIAGWGGVDPWVVCLEAKAFSKAGFHAKGARWCPRSPSNPLVKLALDFAPLALFFIANGRFGIFAATAIFMAATLVALAISYVLMRRLPIMALVSAVVVFVFGGLTLALHDDLFIKMKPTIVNSLFGAVLMIGLALDKPLLPLVLDQVLDADARRLAQAHLALGHLLFRARRAQRDRVAQFLDRHLGQFQGVRHDAAHPRLRARPDAAHPPPWRGDAGWIAFRETRSEASGLRPPRRSS